MTDSERSHSMPALLAPEAIQAAFRRSAVGMDGARMKAVEDFVEYHATEGREALVERVAVVLYPRAVKHPAVAREEAEAVVTALLGGPGA